MVVNSSKPCLWMVNAIMFGGVLSGLLTTLVIWNATEMLWERGDGWGIAMESCGQEESLEEVESRERIWGCFSVLFLFLPGDRSYCVNFLIVFYRTGGIHLLLHC